MKKLLFSVFCLVGLGIQQSTAQLSIEERMRPEYQISPEEQMANLRPAESVTVLSLEEEIVGLEEQLSRIESAMSMQEQSKDREALAQDEDYIKLASAQSSTSELLRRKRNELQKREEVKK